MIILTSCFAYRRPNVHHGSKEEEIGQKNERVDKPRVFVVGREPGRVGRFSNGTRGGDLFEGIDALSSAVQSVHQMHGGRSVAV